VLDDKPDLNDKLLRRLAEWCIRFTPSVAVDHPDGLLLDATGCSHLWNGDTQYLKAILTKLNDRGYDVRASIACTPGVAWAMARYGREPLVISNGMHIEALLPLPPEALRLEEETVERLHKLGLHQISQFINMPRSSLRRRFGPNFLKKLDLATGKEQEIITSVHPIEPYQERLPCLEPIATATGIEIALQQLLKTLCYRLQQEQKGLRSAVFKCYRTDGKVVQVDVGTHRPTHNVTHLFKLAPKVEDHFSIQEKLWQDSGGLGDVRLSELIDRLTGKTGIQATRYLPDEHYWPERSIKTASSLSEKVTTDWRGDKLRPLQLLATPESIEVTAPIPDYPPMLFRYKGEVHTIVRADGPERIEQEWWLQQGQHRDYYRVEDKEGRRYWLFRLGHYDDKSFRWFIHGYFA
jgi:protein ImuB